MKHRLATPMEACIGIKERWLGQPSILKVDGFEAVTLWDL
jgi:hypothetical protein